MKKIIYTSILIVLITLNTYAQKVKHSASFVHIEGKSLVKPSGEKILLKGINLGNWLNPEGYMFLFKDVASFRLINQAFCEMVGEDYTNWFWAQFKKNYIRQADIKYIKQTGMNCIRLPFHYKLFTDEDYMGSSNNQEGFRQIDRIVEWCKSAGLYVILDMHDAPGGQTGDNIDDSYAYPWLMKNEQSKQKCVAIWKKIAAHYANNNTVIAYDLLNEPIAPYFIKDEPHLNDSLEVVYKRIVRGIREVDNNHIVMLGGAQWDGNFTVFKDSKFDKKMMYTCHRYGCDTIQSGIQDLVNFRDSVNLPIYMGETGENKDKWIASFTRLMEQNNIGWSFWPYKKMVPNSCMLTIETPPNWDVIVKFTQQDRSSFAKIRAARPDQEVVKKAMKDLLEEMKFEHCIKNKGYIEAMGMKP